ncbi:hypothetical protein ZIOFF_001801 [Zingiber officinale]|uniref:Protein JASON n=1 Tax=Zingiber officinale TaxID=94328 RepID=A0A8J5IKF9_ZINOF|nr:hypothetical protein ZIOFF_001801 [Zingiber officinale]
MSSGEGLLGFLDGILGRVGCFFGCIRSRNNVEGTKNRKEPSVSKRQLGSFFINEEADSLPDGVVCPIASDTFATDSLYKELKREVEILKACGALLQTPVEIRKASGKVTLQDPDKLEGTSSSYILRFSGISKKILWDEKHEISSIPLQVQNNDGISHESFLLDNQQSPQHNDSLLPSVNSSSSVLLEGVHEYCTELVVETHTPDTSPSKHESHLQLFSSKVSPFATPFRVTDEMETPATIYPSNLEHIRTGKGPRIRNQYVYPVPIVENHSQWKVLNEDFPESFQSHYSFNPDAGEKEQQMSASQPEGSELSLRTRFSSPRSEKQKDEVVYTDKYTTGKILSTLETPSSNTDMKLVSPQYSEVVASLSQWLKPPMTRDDSHNKKSSSAKSSDDSRPILGMVAAHWKDDEPEHTLYKRWDGNGIPNSTNKYKEDQRVNWHSTPFEERLEKALSDESFVSQRSYTVGYSSVTMVLMFHTSGAVQFLV